MNTQALVSAIIPTYNRAHIVCEAVDSVLAQTYSNIEIIIVDDGSKDETLEKLRAYGDKIRLFSQKNAGPAAARNRGIAEARGELIAFLDSDDIWLPSNIERQVSLLHRAGESAPCCMSNILMKWNSGDRTSFDIALLKPSVEEGLWLNPDEILATRFVLFTQASVIRRKVLEKIGGFDLSIRFLEDFEFPLRLSLEGPWAFIETPLVVWRESATNSVSKNAAKEEICTGECLVRILQQQWGRTSDSPEVRRHIKRELDRNLWCLGAARLKEENSWFKRNVGAGLAFIQRIRRGIFVRSPWFPKMKTSRVQGAAHDEEERSLQIPLENVK